MLRHFDYMMTDLMTVLHGLYHLYLSNKCSFNCLLPAFKCQNYATCDEYNGKCKCPPGFGGDDCLSPGTPHPLLNTKC